MISMNFQEKLAGKDKWKFFREIPAQATCGFDVLTMMGEVDDGKPEEKYVVFDAIKVKPALIEYIKDIAEQVWRVYSAGCKYIVEEFSEEDLLECGYLPDYIPHILKGGILPPDMRFDIAVHPSAFYSENYQPQHIRILEANVATPTFFWESFVGNMFVAEHFGLQDPNPRAFETHAALFYQYVTEIAQLYSIDLSKFPLCFSVPQSYIEDILAMATRQAMYSLYAESISCFTDDLVFESHPQAEPALYAHNQLVKMLMVHYPNEWFIEDVGEGINQPAEILDTPARPWDYMAELTYTDRVIKLPSILADITQNKAFMAILYECLEEFDTEIIETIQNHIPRTYFKEVDAAQNCAIWWEKPILGREGAAVKQHTQVQPESLTWNFQPGDEEYLNQLAVFQEHCEMPEIDLGNGSKKLMFTCYVGTNGQATAVAARTTRSEIIDAKTGLWIPIGV